MTGLPSPDNSPTQFGMDDLYISQDATKLKYFTPDKTGRDRFGNRLFTSHNIAYSDRHQDTIKSSLLISPTGEHFIRENRGIIKDIDRGLALLRETPSQYPPGYKDFIELAPRRKMKHLGSGTQSAAYLLEIDEKKYVVKTKGPSAYGFVGSTQPYLNEMLQVQSMSVDLDSQLNELGIHLAKFLFASPIVSCVDYEEGTEPTEEDLEGKIKALKKLTLDYITDQKSKSNTLWTNITPDFYGELGGIRTNNFVQTDKEYLVWLDPFLYREELLR